jgi:CHAD domain-containing protein
MRVGLRRLRAAMSVFKELLSGREIKEIKTELKWLTEELGPARDFDVLIEGQVRQMHHSGPITAELGVPEDDLKARRDASVRRHQWRMPGLPALIRLHGPRPYSFCC